MAQVTKTAIALRYTGWLTPAANIPAVLSLCMRFLLAYNTMRMVALNTKLQVALFAKWQTYLQTLRFEVGATRRTCLGQ